MRTQDQARAGEKNIASRVLLLGLVVFVMGAALVSALFLLSAASVAWAASMDVDAELPVYSISLAANGAITGVVTAEDTGLPLWGVDVYAYAVDDDHLAGSGSTDGDGLFSIDELDSGAYRVEFRPSAPYLAEYYDNFRSWNDFTPVIVDASATISGVNAALAKGHMVTGTVTSVQGDPIADVHVRPYESWSSYFSWDPAAYTAGDGTYAVGPLEPGEYRLAFLPHVDSPYAFQWYSGSATYGESMAVAVPHVAPIDVVLGHGSRITGVVTDPDGSPTSDVNAMIYEAGASSSSMEWDVTTDASGQYLSAALAPGTYQVKFEPPWDSSYAAEWYDDQPTQADAAVITVTAGVNSTNVNAQLAELPETEAMGAITGTVKATDTGQLVGVTACLYEDDPEDMFCGGWADDGKFTIDGWPSGQYHLYFRAPIPYASVFYQDAYVPEEATPITITGNMTTTNVDQVLQIGGSITGTVAVTGSAMGLYGTKVEVSLANSARLMGGGGSWSSFKTRATYAGANGTYRMGGLPTGTYNVRFIPPAPYIGQEYGSAARRFALQKEGSATGTPVSVVLGQVTPNINAALSEGGVITGIITAGDTGMPFLNGAATVYDVSNEVVLSVPADMDGRYTTPGLPAGEYKVLFSGSSDYLSEWNGGAASFGTAPTITVPITGAVVDVNAALDKGGSFSGFVYERETDLSLLGVSIEFYDATNGTKVGSTFTNGWGYYKTSGLPAGQYKAVFTKAGYDTRWYVDADRFDTATPITVSLGQNTPGTDVYLSPTVQEVVSTTVTKTVAPEGMVNYGDALTYTLVISGVPGSQLTLYDALEGTTFVRFVERPITSTIVHASGVITGTLTVIPTNVITVSFVVEVGVPGTAGWTISVTNRACVYPVGGTIEGDCIWSDTVTNDAFRPYDIYLPLVLRST
jgi:hypothetical protein